MVLTNVPPMKLLLFSDLHCDHQAVERIVQASRAADVVIGAGDFATCRRGLQEVIDGLSRIDRPTILVAGNSESAEELQTACRNWPQARVLHGSSTLVENQTFFGLGGAVPVTPFGEWSFDLSEEAACELLRDCPAGAVLVTHSPPFGAVDRDSRGRQLGSRAIRRVVDERLPRLVVCGHIHASGGQSVTLGSTTVINAGPTGMWWDV